MATGTSIQAGELVSRSALAREKVRAGRLVFVDHLRVFLTVLVLAHHLAITYGASGSWPYVERPTTQAAEILLTIFTTLDHFYFMALFFLIAGYFVPGAVDRKGGGKFIQDRLVRLGIPLVIYSLLIGPLVIYVKGVNEGWWHGTPGEFLIQSWRELDFYTGPLWFVEALLIFSLIYAGLRAGMERLGNKIHKAPALGPLTNRKVLAFSLLLAPFSFLTHLVFPVDSEWLLGFQMGMFPQYILMFAAGVLAYRQGWLQEIPEEVRRVWSWAAVLMIVFLPVVSLIAASTGSSEAFKGGLSVEALVLSIWEAFYCPAMAILLLSIFNRYFDRPGRWSAFLSGNAYTVYIIHPPVLIGTALALRGLPLDPLLKWVLGVPLAVSLCFLISHFLLRRIPGAERVL